MTRYLSIKKKDVKDLSNLNFLDLLNLPENFVTM
jgi:hypothetical protein